MDHREALSKIKSIVNEAQKDYHVCEYLTDLMGNYEAVFIGVAALVADIDSDGELDDFLKDGKS